MILISAISGLNLGFQVQVRIECSTAWALLSFAMTRFNFFFQKEPSAKNIVASCCVCQTIPTVMCNKTYAAVSWSVRGLGDIDSLAQGLVKPHSGYDFVSHCEFQWSLPLSMIYPPTAPFQVWRSSWSVLDKRYLVLKDIPRKEPHNLSSSLAAHQRIQLLHTHICHLLHISAF